MNDAKRRLIAVEIKLGFLRIPKELVREFPKKDATKIDFVIDGVSRQLAYNPKYKRIFGLTEFYRAKKATPGDHVVVQREGEKYVITIEKVGQLEKQIQPITLQEAEDVLDVGEVGSTVKGQVVEQRIAELVLLYGQGLLSVYRPLADVEGIDLVVVKRGYFHPLFIQVKGRFNLRGKQLQIGVRSKTFARHNQAYVLGAYFNPQKMDIDDFLAFVPSEDFEKLANKIRKGTDKELFVMNVPLTIDSKNRFAKYLVRKQNLVDEILEKFSDLEKYLK